jgi:hypothetical protein
MSVIWLIVAGFCLRGLFGHLLWFARRRRHRLALRIARSWLVESDARLHYSVDEGFDAVCEALLKVLDG